MGARPLTNGSREQPAPQLRTQLFLDIAPDNASADHALRDGMRTTSRREYTPLAALVRYRPIPVMQSMTYITVFDRGSMLQVHSSNPQTTPEVALSPQSIG